MRSKPTENYQGLIPNYGRLPDGLFKGELGCMWRNSQDSSAPQTDELDGIVEGAGLGDAFGQDVQDAVNQAEPSLPALGPLR